MTVCVLLTMSRFHKDQLSDSIRQTKSVVSVKISSHDGSLHSIILNFISFGRHTVYSVITE